MIEHSQLDIVVVGLGHQSVEDHVPALQESDMFRLVGVSDVEGARAAEIGRQLGVPWDVTVEGLLGRMERTPDAALVAVPHSNYLSIIEALASQGIHIIKEKPFVTSVQDARTVCELVRKSGITLQVTLQRRFNPIYLSFEQLIKRIGRIHRFEARYTMNVARLDEGWRASRLFAGGGVVIDLGYHYIDLIVWYFGLPDSVICKLSSGNREEQAYDVEDTAILQFSYGEQSSRPGLLGTLILSRVDPDKDEILTAYGTKGSATVQRGRVTRRDLNGNNIEVLERTDAWPSALIDQLEEFGRRIQRSEMRGTVESRYLEQAALVEAAYRSAATEAATDPHVCLDEITGQR